MAENRSGLEAEKTTAGNGAGDFAEVPRRCDAGAGAHTGQTQHQGFQEVRDVGRAVVLHCEPLVSILSVAL